MTKRSPEYRGANYRTATPRRAKVSTAGDILARALRRFGIEDQIARYEFILHWEEVVGKEIAERTRPEGIRGKTLLIRVKNSAWAQELSFQKDVILGRLRDFLEKDDVVDDIYFFVGNPGSVSGR